MGGLKTQLSINWYYLYFLLFLSSATCSTGCQCVNDTI